MSFLPIMFREMLRPMRMMEQQARIMQEEFMNPRYLPSFFNHPRPWRLEYRADTEPSVTTDKNQFQVKMDVQQFKPEEIMVKLNDEENMVVVEAKHDEGKESKYFLGRFLIPDGHNLKEMVSNLSSDGILTISAPKSIESQERIIPIEKTGPIREEKNTKETENK